MATKQPKQRESLAECVLRAPPGRMVTPMASPIGIEPELEPKPDAPAPAALGPGRQRKSVGRAPGLSRYVTLREWAAMMFSKVPHRNTLQKWVNEGHIQPQPRKIGRRWFVKRDAEYVD